MFRTNKIGSSPKELAMIEGFKGLRVQGFKEEYYKRPKAIGCVTQSRMNDAILFTGGYYWGRIFRDMSFENFTQVN